MYESKALAPVVGRLARYEGLKLRQSRESVSVLATREDEFDIRVVAQSGAEGGGQSGRFTVHFEQWSRTVDDLETAWNLVAVGLSDGARLRVQPTEHGRTLNWLEVRLPDGSWRTLPEEGIEPDRQNRLVYYRQNAYARAFYRPQVMPPYRPTGQEDRGGVQTRMVRAS